MLCQREEVAHPGDHWRDRRRNGPLAQVDALSDGRSTGDSLICSKDHIRRWADREATEEEKATLERDAPTIKDLAAVAMINYTLANLSDHQLIDEIRRRVYEVVRRENSALQKKGTRTATWPTHFTNANPGNLGEDFGRLGIEFWDEVKKLSPRNSARNRSSGDVEPLRNAIAHQHFDPAKLGTTNLGLAQVRNWRNRVRPACAGVRQSNARTHPFGDR